MFPTDMYLTIVPEDLAVGSILDLDIIATDNDDGDDGNVTYSLAYEGNERVS